MQIDQTKLDALYGFYKELDELEWQASEELKKAKEAGKEKTIKLHRNGADRDIKEGILWTEVFHLGSDSEAGKALKERYPGVFDLYEKQSKKAGELQKFCVEAFGIDYTNLRLSDIFRICEAMIPFLIKRETKAQA
jgi:hypothetical protein